jgi:hypothetical protein
LLAEVVWLVKNKKTYAQPCSPRVGLKELGRLAADRFARFERANILAHILALRTMIVIAVAAIFATILAAASDAVAIGATVVVQAIATLFSVAVAAVCGSCLRPHWNEGEGHHGGQ